MNALPEILQALREGQMIVLADDESRENEGDLVIAAEMATPDALNFMLREARGMMCVALAPDICERLDLTPPSTINTSQRSTAYTITVDAHQRFGVTTGVSAADRAATVRTLIDPTSTPQDFDRPGHMQPLRARDGGSLVRAGQTEGSVDLCKLAGLKAGAVIIEVMNDDGTMARRPELETLCAKHNLKMCTVADVIEHRLQTDRLVERIETTPFTNDIGEFNLIAYRSLVDPFPHVALTCGNVGELDPNTGQAQPIDEPILVRMHSHNLLGDVFGDVTQPSGQTLQQAMQMIQAEGRGAIVYLRHDRMGQGLVQRLQTQNTPEPSDDALDVEKPERPPKLNDYGIGSQILRDLGLSQLNLITNHPFTPTALSGFGLTINSFVGLKQ